jgi:hypothetical protein
VPRSWGYRAGVWQPEDSVVADLISGFGLVPAAGAVVRGDVVPALLTENTDNVDRSNGPGYTTASVTPTANRLTAIAICCSHATAAEVPSSVTGCGLTWTQMSPNGTQTYAAGNRRVTWFYAFGASPSAGAITINFATTHTGCTWAVFDFPGARLSTAPVQGAVGTAASTTVTATLAALESSKSAVIYALGRVLNEVSAPPAAGSWTELSDRAGTSPPSAMETAWAINDVDANPTWATSGGSAIVLLEIKAA